MLPDVFKKKLFFEISEIDLELKSYKLLLDLAKRQKPDLVEMTALGSVIHSFYNGLENIFILIAKNIDKRMPKGEKWHYKLLVQMKTGNNERESVISEDVFAVLKEYLQYRHYFRHSYKWRLEWNEFKNLAVKLDDVWQKTRKELLSSFKLDN